MSPAAVGVDADVAEYALRLGDDALILAQRLAEWSACAPQIEEDMALTNIGLDLLGQARTLLTLAGELDGSGRSEDDLAFLRDERSFRNARLVEQPNGDFADTIARQLIFSAYQLPLYAELTASACAPLAALAGKAVKEVAYHRDHAVQWTLRLGDGTDESHLRMQASLARMWPWHHELFAADELVERLVEAGVAADPAVLRAAWDPFVSQVIEQATLTRPDDAVRRRARGRAGEHGERFGYLLTEMQWLHRSHPGVTW